VYIVITVGVLLSLVLICCVLNLSQLVYCHILVYISLPHGHVWLTFFAERYQGSVSYWPCLSVSEFGWKRLFWTSLCGFRESKGECCQVMWVLDIYISCHICSVHIMTKQCHRHT